MAAPKRFQHNSSAKKKLSKGKSFGSTWAHLGHEIGNVLLDNFEILVSNFRRRRKFLVADGGAFLSVSSDPSFASMASVVVSGALSGFRSAGSHSPSPLWPPTLSPVTFG